MTHANSLRAALKGFRYTGIAALSLVISHSLAHATATVTSEVGVGPTVLDQGVRSASGQVQNVNGLDLRGYANPGGLGAFASATGGGVQVSGSINSSTSFNIELTSSDKTIKTVDVFLSASLNGSMGRNDNANANVGTALEISGWTPQNNTLLPPQQIIDRDEFSRSFGGGEFNIILNESVSVKLEDVLVDRGLSIFTSLGTFASAGGFRGSGAATANFFNSLNFNPDQFFTFSSGAVTANSVEMGLINNQLPAFQSAAVPTPGTLWLFATALAGLTLLGVGRRCRQGCFSQD